MKEQEKHPWIESGGGPLMVMPEGYLHQWTGVDSSKGNESDYDRACGIDDYLGILEIDGASALVLGDEPLPTTWVPSRRGGFLVRWVYADDEAIVDSYLAKLDSIGADLMGSMDVDVVSFTVPGRCVLFDSAESGWNLEGDSIVIELRAGTYLVTSCMFSPSPEISMIVHKLDKCDFGD